jgi:hypothetical protein
MMLTLKEGPRVATSTPWVNGLTIFREAAQHARLSRVVIFSIYKSMIPDDASPSLKLPRIEATDEKSSGFVKILKSPFVHRTWKSIAHGLNNNATCFTPSRDTPNSTWSSHVFNVTCHVTVPRFNGQCYLIDQ